MAAPLSSFSGGRIYIDTMIFYLLLRGNNHAQIRFFFKRMEHGDFAGYTSVLTFDELAYRLVLAFIRDKYTGSPLDLLRSREAELHEFSPRVQTLLEQLLQFPHLHLVDLRGEDITQMGHVMVDYLLRPRDALHLIAAQRIGCQDIASGDSHFDRVPFLNRYTP